MRGFNILVHILLACISIATASPDIASNKINSADRQKLLKALDSNVHDVLSKIKDLRTNLIRKRGIENFIINSQKRKCDDVVSMLKALEEDIKEIQKMQLKESIIASGNDAAVNTLSNYLDSYRKIEYILRDIAGKLRKLAKNYEITNFPKYTVGLSHKEVLDVQKEKFFASAANEQAYKKLTAMKKCIKVFKKKFIAYRLLPDPFQSNSFGNFAHMGQEYDLSNNDIFHNF